MNEGPFLVDTSAWIFALRKNPQEIIKNRVAQLLEKDAVIITEMIKLELLGGTKTEKEFSRLKARLRALDSVPAGAVQWERAYDLAFTLRRKGVNVPYTDILIAACALEAGAVLLHTDVHFDTIAGHVPLKTESYVKLVKT
jgi:hypothetical protein